MANFKERLLQTTLEALNLLGLGGVELAKNAYNTGEPFMASGLDPHTVRAIDLQQTVENMVQSPTEAETERFKRYGITDPEQMRLYYAQGVLHSARTQGIPITLGRYKEEELNRLEHPTDPDQPESSPSNKPRKRRRL